MSRISASETPLERLVILATDGHIGLITVLIFLVIFFPCASYIIADTHIELFGIMLSK
jgi:hypothetical protein